MVLGAASPVPPPAQSERRAEQRYPLRLPIVVKSFPGGVSEESSLTRDVSARGAFFFLKSSLAEGTPVELLLTLPAEITLTESVQVRCRGKVVRVSERSSGGKIGTAALIEQYDFTRPPDPALTRPREMPAAAPVLVKRSRCRGCDGKRLTLFLSLGELPLANALLTKPQLEQTEPRFPLEVYYCEDCSLVQLLHVVDPKVLFSNYLYRTGTNQTIADHNLRLAGAVIDRLKLSCDDLVIEIASNDGSLLRCFRDRGLRTVGVEPAANIARLARDSGIDTVEEFFGPDCAASVVERYGQASAVLANNVLAHVDHTVEFLAACKTILRPQGRVIIEVPYAAEMLRRLEYDTIYHEHLCYFSVNALMRLFSQAGLELEDVEQVDIHGGSLRLWAGHAGEVQPCDSVRRLAEKERELGLTRLKTYQDFASQVAEHRTQLRDLLRNLRAQGKRIVGYGAPAKGNTLLCYCGIDTRLLAYTVDRSTLKIGRYTPGAHIPVAPVDRILKDQPDYVLVLAWNFADEIMASLADYHSQGGRFILPVPQPRIV